MKNFALCQLREAFAAALILFVACALWLGLAALLPDEALSLTYGALIWLVCPLLGGYLTIRSVRRGLQPYIAPWALPFCPAAAQLAVTGTALDMRAIVVYALIGLICAATGDELNKRRAAPKK